MTRVNPWMMGKSLAVIASNKSSADTGQAENGFGEHGSAEQQPELEPDDRYHREHRISQGVPSHHLPFHPRPWPGRSDAVAAQNVEER